MFTNLKFGSCTLVLDEPETFEEIFVLLTDGDGTIRSIEEPFGVAVTTEKEAKRFVEEGYVGYSQSYCKVKIFTNKDDVINWRYPPRRVHNELPK